MKGLVLTELFWSKVAPQGDCWVWSGGGTSAGYGQFKRKYVHRLSYEEMVGEIPQGLVLDHLCRNKRCVNPDHLDPTTIGINVTRGFEALRQLACKRGHKRTPENTYTKPDGYQECRTCRVINRRRSYLNARH